MQRPSVVFVLDINHDKNAVAEAPSLIFLIFLSLALVDTNVDQASDISCAAKRRRSKDYSVVLDYVKQAIEAGKSARKVEKVEDKKKGSKYGIYRRNQEG